MNTDITLHRSNLTGAKAWQLIQNFIFFMRKQALEGTKQVMVAETVPMIVYGFQSINTMLAPTNQVELIFEQNSWHRYNSKVYKAYRLDIESNLEKYLVKSLEFFVSAYRKKSIKDCRGDMTVVKELKGYAKAQSMYQELIKARREAGTWCWVKPTKSFAVTHHDLYLLHTHLKHYKTKRLTADEEKQLATWIGERYDTIATEAEFMRRQKMDDKYQHYKKLTDKLYIPTGQLLITLNTTQNHIGPKELLLDSRAARELTQIIEDYTHKNNLRREKLIHRRDKQLKRISDNFTYLLHKCG